MAMAPHRNRQSIDDAASDSSMDSLDRKILGLPSKPAPFEQQPPSPSPAPRFQPNRPIRRPTPTSAAPQFPPLSTQRRSIYDVPKMQALLARQAAAYAAVQENERQFMAESYLQTNRYTNSFLNDKKNDTARPWRTFGHAHTYNDSILEQEASIMATPERRPTNEDTKTYNEDLAVEQGKGTIGIPEVRRTNGNTKSHARIEENIYGQGESTSARNYRASTDHSLLKQDDSIMSASEHYLAKPNMDISTEDSIMRAQEPAPPTQRSTYLDHTISNDKNTLQPLAAELRRTMESQAAAKIEEKPVSMESQDAIVRGPTAEERPAASATSLRRVRLKTPKKALVRRLSQKKVTRTPSINEPLSTTTREPSIQDTKSTTVHLSSHLAKLNYLRLWTCDDNRTIGFRLTWLGSVILTFLIWYYLENRVHNFIGKPLYATGTQQWSAAGPEWGDAIPTLLDKAFGWPVGEVVRIPKTVLFAWPSQLRTAAKDWVMLGLSELEREAIRKDVPIAALYRSRIADEVVRMDGWDKDEVL